MGGRDEAFGDGGVAFVVDAEASTVDQPSEGAFHDPSESPAIASISPEMSTAYRIGSASVSVLQLRRTQRDISKAMVASPSSIR